METQLQELIQFLDPKTRLDVKTIALSYVLGLTATSEGRAAILTQRETILRSLLGLTVDESSHDICHNAYMAVISLSGHDEFADHLIHLDVVPKLIQAITDHPDSKYTNMAVMVLANVTRPDQGAESFAAAIQSSSTLYKLVDMFDKHDLPDDRSVHYLASVFSNVTKVQSVRLMFLDKQVCVLPCLTPYIHYQDSLVRRGGIIGMIRNLCFETSYHEWLLGPEIDLLPFLLLPLAGPEQFTDEETDTLPMDLQYLPDDKQREPDPDLRKMLIETLLKLCATKPGRSYLKDHNTYLILRELDRWEKESEVKEACQNVIAILIADEPEPSLCNLDEVEIPEDIKKKFDNADSKRECNN